jgi:porin
MTIRENTAELQKRMETVIKCPLIPMGAPDPYQPRSANREGSEMRMTARIAALGLLLVVPATGSAQPHDVPDTWGGDLLSRPRLTGSWGGFRDEMGKKGIVLDVDVILTPQAVATGGIDTGADFWGNTEYTLNVDTQKAGLWPGGFLKVVGNSAFGDNILGDSGAAVAPNTALLLPSTKPTSALMNATFMQFLSPKLGLIAGKIFTVDGALGEFTGNYRTQFENTALTFPMAAALVPLSAYGGGLVGIPWEHLLLTASAIDPDGTPTNDDISDAFQNGVTVLGGGLLTIEPFGLVGHQSLNFIWSDKERLSLIQDPSNLGRLLLEDTFPRLGDPGPTLHRILERFFPNLLVPVRPANHESSTWAVFYGFEQYLWQPAGDPKRGVGLFFTFGASDGDANPIKYSYDMGIGGNGVMSSRPHDSFGIGWARTEFSDHFLPFLRQRLDLGLDREDAVEMYYNVAVTGWLDATFDLQVIDTGLERALSSSSGKLERIGTTVMPGVRLYVRL